MDFGERVLRFELIQRNPDGEIEGTIKENKKKKKNQVVKERSKLWFVFVKVL